MSEDTDIGSLLELQRLFEDYKEKIFVLDFYSNLCVPCRRAKPKIEKLMRATCPYTLFVLIEVRDDPGIRQILEEYRVFTIPKFVVVKDKQTLLVTNDPDELRDKLKKLISDKTRRSSSQLP